MDYIEAAEKVIKIAPSNTLNCLAIAWLQDDSNRELAYKAVKRALLGTDDWRKVKQKATKCFIRQLGEKKSNVPSSWVEFLFEMVQFSICNRNLNIEI